MDDQSKRPKRQLWNYTPSLPIKVAPYWAWPVKPVASAVWLLKSWNPIGMRFLFLAAAVVTWAFFTPDIDQAHSVSWEWIWPILLRNFVILTTVAGGLHLILWALQRQGDDFRFDMRPMMKGAKVFWFKNQVWDNILWSYVAMVFWTCWECLMWWAYANGWASLITYESHPVWFLALIILIPIWAGFHFYWLHRLLHVGPFYKHVHAWHHRNINVGPWSGLAMHPVESFFLFFDTMIFFLITAHPIHVIFLMFHHGIGAPTSHAGFERVKVGKTQGLEVGDFFHQLHHRFFDCNYGTWETPWDTWFNTFHDGSDAGNHMVKERRRKIWQS